MNNVKNFMSLQRESGRVDQKLTKQLNDEVKYWNAVLTRVVEIIKYKLDQLLVCESAKMISKKFPTDVKSETILFGECNHFNCILLTEDIFKNNENHTLFKILQFIKQNEFELVISNLTIVF